MSSATKQLRTLQCVPYTYMHTSKEWNDLSLTVWCNFCTIKTPEGIKSVVSRHTPLIFFVLTWSGSVWKWWRLKCEMCVYPWNSDECLLYPEHRVQEIHSTPAPQHTHHHRNGDHHRFSSSQKPGAHYGQNQERTTALTHTEHTQNPPTHTSTHWSYNFRVYTHSSTSRTRHAAEDQW